MTMPSRRSTECASAARRRSVSRFPRPASTSRRVREVSSKVQLPELPDARMLTRRLMDSPPNLAPQHAHFFYSVALRARGARTLPTPYLPAREAKAKKISRPHASSQKRRAHVNGFEEFCDRKFQQASSSRFSWKPLRGPTTVA